MMLETDVLSQLPPGDWDATPASVREVLLRLMPLAEESMHRRAVARHQELVDKMFAGALSDDEREELQHLSEAIDEANAPFYKQAMERARGHASPAKSSGASA